MKQVAAAAAAAAVAAAAAADDDAAAPTVAPAAPAVAAGAVVGEGLVPPLSSPEVVKWQCRVHSDWLDYPPAISAAIEASFQR